MKKTTLSVLAILLFAPTTQARVAGNKVGAFEISAGLNSIGVLLDDDKLGLAPDDKKPMPLIFGSILFAGYDFYLSDKWSVMPAIGLANSFYEYTYKPNSMTKNQKIAFKDMRIFALKAKYRMSNQSLLFIGLEQTNGKIKYTYAPNYKPQYSVTEKIKSLGIIAGYQAYVRKHVFIEGYSILAAKLGSGGVSVGVGF